MLKPTRARKERIYQAIEAGPPGRVQHWSQKDLEPGNKVNCQLYAACQAMTAAGLRVVGGAEMKMFTTEVLRGATGVPEGDEERGFGTSMADLARAVREVFPWMHMRQRFIDNDELLEGLRDKRLAAVVRVFVPDLPARQRRWFSPRAKGHYVTLVGARKIHDVPEVHFLDCFAPRRVPGKGRYRGDWVPFRDLRPALWTHSGKTLCSIWEAGDVMQTTTVLVQAWGSTPATVTLAPGTYKVVVFDDDLKDYRAGKDHIVKVTEEFHADYRARIERMPERGVKGGVLHIIDGALAGRFLRPFEVKVTPPGKPALAASIAAAEQRGYERALAEFQQPVELPKDIFRRVRPE